jgi:predicted nucleic acid-binding protein
MAVVVDASVIVDALLGGELGRAITAEMWRRGDKHAPVTIDAEVLHAVRRRWLRGDIPDTDAQRVLAVFQTTKITRHPVQPLVDRMWALRQNITAYDAGYVALAETLNMPLLTRDRRLSQSSGHGARIDYIA